MPTDPAPVRTHSRTRPATIAILAVATPSQACTPGTAPDPHSRRRPGEPRHGPVAECLEHAPPALFAPVTPPDGRDPFGAVLEEAPPIVATIAITGATVAAVVVIGGVTVAAWAVGVVLDALRGRA